MFGYWRARASLPSVGLREGTRVCTVYSDAPTRRAADLELSGWMERHRFPAYMLRRNPRGRPYVLAHGRALRACGAGVSRGEYLAAYDAGLW